MHMDDKFSLELTQEEGILLLTSARLLDKLVAGVTIYSKDRDELIREIIEKLSAAVSPAMASMSDELADAIVESVLGCDEPDDFELDLISVSLNDDEDLHEVYMDSQPVNYPMYNIDRTMPILERALVEHTAVRVEYYSFVRESVDELVLNPLTITQEEGVWRMIAYCHERDEVLVFRVDRIKSISATADRFETPNNFHHLKRALFASYC